MIISKQLSGGSTAPTIKLELTARNADIENNQTTVDYKLTIERPYEIRATATKPYTIKIGSKIITGSNTIGGTGTKILRSGSVTISHDTDGTKTVYCSFSIDVDMSWSGTYNGNISASNNMELPNIPRVTQPEINVSSAEMGESVTFKLLRASTNFTHKLRLKYGGYALDIADNLGVSYQWTIPLALAKQIPNSTSMKALIVCYTYNNGDYVGSKSVYLTINVPLSVKPTITSIQQKDVSTVKFGLYVQNQSRLQIDIASSGVYGSKITDITATLNGTTYKGVTFTADLPFNGTKSLNVIVTDSRGRKTTETIDIDVVAWKKPKVSFTAERCDISGNVKEDGECIKVVYSFDIATVGNNNDKRVVFGYAETGATSFTQFHEITNLYTGSGEIISNPIFSVDSSYLIRLIAYDTFTYSKTYAEIETDTTIFDILASGKGIAIGKVAELEDVLDVNFNAKFRKEVEFISDKEWTNIPLTAEYKAYDTEQVPQYRIKGNTVEVRGAVSPLTAYTSSNERKIFGDIPSKYAPTTALYIMCQGSGMARWLFSVQPNGALTVSRYGKTAYEEIPLNAWLTFHATWTI